MGRTAPVRVDYDTLPEAWRVKAVARILVEALDAQAAITESPGVREIVTTHAAELRAEHELPEPVTNGQAYVHPRYGLADSVDEIPVN